MMNLDPIRVVLVATTHPGNIGAAARAMKTMGLSRLVLVEPLAFPHAEATARAAGADDLLAQAQVVDSLEAALAGCRLVFGTSARRRHLGAPILDPRQFAEQALVAVEHGQEVALLFGQERIGLTNEQLDHCHYQVQIPSNPEYGSLNLGAAVQVLTYELRMSATLRQPPAAPATPVHVPAPAEEVERFYAHLEQVLLATGFLDPANPRHLMRRLRRLFNRARPDQNEVNILRGILSSVQDPHPPPRSPQ
ncbi:MAG TPA: tRNA (cytosine(32)/uridine(32)-2'-O)-methyltransferase TrmJ [Candidatus Competibacteraceae bacterium]|nr:tRNA (cytosine(32)/uridine(32)-2'-O)-methyltransferase TrmJ [Candidatus Competibacteraceae bacterium]